MLKNLHRKQHFRRMRASSYDRTGGNRDSARIEPGQLHEVPTLAGPGIIRHLWLTVAGKTRRMYRETRLVIMFDDTSVPQVDVPLADFFLFGHGDLVDVNSGPIQVSRQPAPHRLDPPFAGGLNALFPMPFAHQARMMFANDGPEPVSVYYYVDWEAHDAVPDPVLHFHATLHAGETRPPAGQATVAHGRSDGSLENRSDAGNYVFLDVSGCEGHYAGTGLSVECRPGSAGKWWEGDDMFVIDGEPWPPRLHGTGTEDYFNLAWGFRQADCRPEYGVTFLDRTGADQTAGRFSMYRFHLNDPIPFERSLRASIEHGHANDCEALYRSVAFWYGRPVPGI